MANMMSQRHIDQLSYLLEGGVVLLIGIFFFFSVGTGTRIGCLIIGKFIPAYQTINSIPLDLIRKPSEKNVQNNRIPISGASRVNTQNSSTPKKASDDDAEQGRAFIREKLIKYWSVHGVYFLIHEYFQNLLSWVPFAYHIQLIFLVYCQILNFRGTEKLLSIIGDFCNQLIGGSEQSQVINKQKLEDQEKLQQGEPQQYAHVEDQKQDNEKISLNLKPNVTAKPIKAVPNVNNDKKDLSHVESTSESKLDTKLSSKFDSKPPSKLNAELFAKFQPESDPKFDSNMNNPKLASKLNSKIRSKPTSKLDSKVDSESKVGSNPLSESKIDSNASPKADSKLDTTIDSDSKLDPISELKMEPSLSSQVDLKLGIKLDHESHTEQNLTFNPPNEFPSSTTASDEMKENQEMDNEQKSMTNKNEVVLEKQEVEEKK